MCIRSSCDSLHSVLHTVRAGLYLEEAESLRLLAVCAGLQAVRTGEAQVILQLSPLQRRPAAWVAALQRLKLTRPQVLLQGRKTWKIKHTFKELHATRGGIHVC